MWWDGGMQAAWLNRTQWERKPSSGLSSRICLPHLFLLPRQKTTLSFPPVSMASCLFVSSLLLSYFSPQFGSTPKSIFWLFLQLHLDPLWLYSIPWILTPSSYTDDSYIYASPSFSWALDLYRTANLWYTSSLTWQHWTLNFQSELTLSLLNK